MKINFVCGEKIHKQMIYGVVNYFILAKTGKILNKDFLVHPIMKTKRHQGFSSDTLPKN